MTKPPRSTPPNTTHDTPSSAPSNAPSKRGPDACYAAPVNCASAHGTGDGRLQAPAAERNRDAITEALHRIAPANGLALELASGTGQHVVHFAAHLPGLIWQPTDPAADRRASINAWIRTAPAGNIRPARDLDACAPGWGAREGPVDLIFLANLLHLISDPEAKILLAEAASALAPSGRVALYGPYLRDGRPVSDGDADFDARIRADMPEAGYKDRAWVEGQLAAAGLQGREAMQMPANNLILWAERPAP